jgi:hypothetical protein
MQNALSKAEDERCNFLSLRHAKAAVSDALTERTKRRGIVDLQSICHEGARLAMPVSLAVNISFWIHQRAGIGIWLDPSLSQSLRHSNWMLETISLWIMLQIVVAICWLIRQRRSSMILPAMAVIPFLLTAAASIMIIVPKDPFAPRVAKVALVAAAIVSAWSLLFWKAMGNTTPRPNRRAIAIIPVLLLVSSVDLGRMFLALCLVGIPLVALVFGRVYPHALMATALTVLPVLAMSSIGLWTVPNGTFAASMITAIIVVGIVALIVRLRSSLRFLDLRTPNSLA